MTDRTAQPLRFDDFWTGARAAVPVIIASGPFALLFGTIAIQNGLAPAEAVLMSAAMFAGASQMVGIELFNQQIAPGLVVFSIFAVNFRHVLYSAAVGRRTSSWTGLQRAFWFFFLVDPVYAEAERRGESGQPVTVPWFAGMGLAMYVSWVILTGVGVAFGRLIPDTHAIGLDYLLPIYFMGLVIGFRKRPRWLPVVLASSIASVAAFHLVGSPWHVSIGAIAGVVLAAILTPSRVPEPRTPGDRP